MPQNYSSRITLIVAVLAAALVAILWPSLANPGGVGLNPNEPWSRKLNLKPGIDIVGGVSLLYEIKAPEDGRSYPNLAEQVTTALKRRVDPDGTKNLIWRPENPNRLEIQLPFSGSSDEAAKRRAELDKARAEVEATNVHVNDVIRWVEQGSQRTDARKAELAKGYTARNELLTKLAAAFDERQAAIDNAARISATDPDSYPAAEERVRTARRAYDQLLEQLPATNLPLARLDAPFSGRGDKVAQKTAADKLKAQLAADNFPARTNAAVAYIDARLNTPEGIDSASDLKRLLSGAGVLEFHILPSQVTGPRSDPAGGYEAWVRRLNTLGPIPQPEDQYRWFEVDEPEQFGGHRTETYEGRQYVLASLDPKDSLDRRSGSWKLASVQERFDEMGRGMVHMTFDSDGKVKFGELTSANVKRPMAIMLDGRVISAPVIQQAITGGDVTISNQNGFEPKELDYLIKMLSGGSLPAQLSQDPIYERAVGPQLGEDNLISGLIACALGLVVVAIFLIGYYYTAGAVAFVGVLLNLVLILGAMAALNATFTLPGIAAIILTVGSAVDSNVLIFERLREEQQRGLPLRQALRNAYDRALSAIIDSNMTTVITSAFLIIFGTEEVKGFGITLVIGIVASLFTSLYVTKTVFGLLVDRFGVRKLGSLPLSIPRWNELLRPSVRWTRLILPFAGLSALFIVIGCIIFGVSASRGQVMDIEFASGTSVTFELAKPADQDTVREWMNAESARNPALPAANTVRVGADDTTYEVTTPNADRNAVQAAVLNVVRDKLRAEPNANFVGITDGLQAVLAKQGGILPTAATATVVPLTADVLSQHSYRQLWPNGSIPEEARRYSNGAAMFLRGLEPKLSPRQVSDRLTRQRLQATSAAARPLPSDITVISANGTPADQPATDVIVLAADPTLDYAKLLARATTAGDLRQGDPASVAAKQWTDGIEPLWDLTRSAIGKAPELQQVRSVNASVAGETQQQAIIALVLSLVVIMAYIWLRFGNLKYGTATIVALVHDVLFCFAALGFAHLFSRTWLGELLLLQPFRINLTLIAAILTVMGYSMLDTIVVFDRIREIRGKYGHVSATVVNDAINQTLSRTLLTAGTTIVSVAIMYFIGGEGIHGFTFVLFVGILAGTYSSIAIASPILLVGGGKEREATATPKAGAPASA